MFGKSKTRKTFGKRQPVDRSKHAALFLKNTKTRADTRKIWSKLKDKK